MRDLVARCAENIGYNVFSTLASANKMSDVFQKYIDGFSYLNIAENISEFVHRGAIRGENCHEYAYNLKDASHLFLPSIFDAVANGDQFKSNCLGLAIAGAYLLDSQNIDFNIAFDDRHVMLLPKVNGKFFPLDMIVRDGFGRYIKGRTFTIGNKNDFEAMVSNSFGCFLGKIGEKNLAKSMFCQALDLMGEKAPASYAENLKLVS